MSIPPVAYLLAIAAAAVIVVGVVILRLAVGW
jgi:hypothetical protein